MTHLSRSNRWWVSGLASAGVIVPLLALLIGVGWSEPSSAQGDNRSDLEFNHASTGFQLTGGHAQVVCERCHAQGVFRGTPTQCFQCHSPGGRVFSTFKPANHLPTTVNCNSCHRTTNWVPAYFTHNGVPPGTCAKCHDNIVQPGKPPTHLPTALSCDACHRPTAWTAVAFSHAGVVPGTCVTCHDGVKATGKTPTHIVTSLSCDSCHRAGTRWGLASNSYDHTGITTGCNGCHNGTTALGKPTNHIPVSLGCENCHSTWRFGPGTPMNHTGIAGGCAACHDTGKKFVGGVMTKPVNHIPTASACETCHQSTVTFSGTLMNHAGITSGCSSCHGTGKTFVGGIVAKPASHFPTTQSDCTGCHIVPASPGTGSFAGGTFNHAAASIAIGGGKCATCHSGAYVGVLGKPATHITTASACDSCHTNPAFTSFAGAAATPNHSTFTSSTNCVSSTCHNGTAAVGKPSNHIPTTLTTCGSCHRWPPTASSFAGTVMDAAAHNAVSATTCATCHATGMAFFGVTMMTKPANHFPTTGDCGSCHKSTATGGFANTAFGHTGISIGSHNCGTCHTGSYVGVLGKPATHIVTSSSCDNCHKNFTSFAGAAVDHSTFTPPVTSATNCATANCHDGKTAVGKPAGHIPTTLTTCGSCHKNWPPAASSFAGTLMDAAAHTAVAATTCATCHATGMAFFGVTMMTKPANHFPTTGDCKTCHSTASFNGAAMNHAGIITGCTTCHNGSAFAGVTPVAKPANHFPTAIGCELCHTVKTTGGFSQYITPFPHPGITTGCMTCHGGVGGAWPWAGAVTGIQTKPVNHLPTTYSCEVCHKSTALWSGGKMDHLGVTTGCMTCHGSAAPITFAGVTPLSQPATNHNLLGNALACESCHRSTSTFTVASMNHNVIPAITGRCASCHERGDRWVGGIITRPTNHTGKEAAPNSCDNSGCHRGYTSFSK